ncbi:MAG: FG-GAP repeat protein [Planctomycetota bacterium]
MLIPLRCAFAILLLLMGATRVDAALGDELLKLTASDGQPLDSFGISVALGEGIALIGASEDDNSAGFDAGAAYLFDTATGAELAKLAPNDPDEGTVFGESVAIDGGTAIVGAVVGNGVAGATGAAYLFDVATGTQTAKLVAADGATFDFFGGAVALSDGTALVGSRFDDDAGDASGSAYLFDTTSGTQLAKLTANDAAAGNQFGGSVAVSIGVALIGSPRSDDAGDDSGAAYIFDASTGAQLSRLTPTDAAAFDRFGQSVDVDGGVALVGSPGVNDFTGAAYLFDANTGVQLARLAAIDAQAGDFFGRSVAIEGGFALVGSFRENDNAGAAYVFDVATGTQLAKLTAADTEEGDNFGFDVDLNGGTAILSSLFDDDGADNSGSAYLFEIAAMARPGPGDFSGNGVVDNDDLNLLLNNWGEPATPTGWNGRPVQGDFVDNDELNELLNFWGVGASAAVPEPSAAWLIAIGAVARGRRIRR